MEADLFAGIVFTVLGLVGYVVGTAVAYPGRSLSVTALMAGITLVAIGRAGGEEDAA